MIRLQAIGLYRSDFSDADIKNGEARLGDSWIMDDGKEYIVCDAGCGKYTERTLDVLEDRKILRPHIINSHPHGDHFGVRKIIKSKDFKPKSLSVPDPDSYGDVSGEVRSNKQALRDLIAEAKERKIPVVYLRNENRIVRGDIKFTVYQDTKVGYTGNSEGYVNDRSLAFWFSELSYLTTGDAGMWCVQKYGLKPKWVKGGHHGNRLDGATLKPSQMAPVMKKNGCLYYWDNDFSTVLTGFLMTGREDALNAGMKFINIHGDINTIWFGKRAVIYKGSDIYRYACSYTGKATIKDADLDIVKTVLRGTAGSDDARISYLLNHNYNPALVQKQVNEIVKLVKG